ncbi:toast rack family protein [Pseudalkalibacillus sp. Hm43]|uniref:toast rack family protein n=1 Tax=Pseudalkalibacillus sp. Hm43 TaxID=3450742 RepID=UPI003F42502A
MFTKEKTKKVIERKEEKELEVSLQLGAGKLQVTGGTNQIMEGTFSYKGEEMDPHVNYEIHENQKGDLTVSQKSTKGWDFFSVKQDWEVALNDTLPLSLNLALGAGKSDLNLTNLKLKDLVIEAGVGETKIDLSGDWKESFKVKIDSGVGKTRVMVPKRIGVSLDVDKGVGKIDADYFMKVGSSYQNQAYETADVKIDIDIDIGIGDVIIEQIS